MIIYVSNDGTIKVDVNIENENIWMSQELMANLYGTTKQNISYHLNNIFKEKELDRNSVVKDSLITANNGKVTHEQALKKAHEEYDKYIESHLTIAEKDYLEVLNKELKEIN